MPAFLMISFVHPLQICHDRMTITLFKYEMTTVCDTDADRARSSIDLIRCASLILSKWNVPLEQRSVLLGMGNLKKREYVKILNGYREIDEETVLPSCKLIVKIHQATRQLFPFSEESAQLWMSIPQRNFDGISSLEMIRDKGFEGLRLIENLLDGESLLPERND